MLQALQATVLLLHRVADTLAAEEALAHLLAVEGAQAVEVEVLAVGAEDHSFSLSFEKVD